MAIDFKNPAWASSVSDDDLREIRNAADTEITQRKDAKKEALVASFRKQMEEAGIPAHEILRTEAGTRPPPRRGPTTFRKGVPVFNPEDPREKWIPGFGRPPAWASRLMGSEEALQYQKDDSEEKDSKLSGSGNATN